MGRDPEKAKRGAADRRRPGADCKWWAHGRKFAYTPRADGCRAYGLCVVACPEDAIRLVEAGVAA